MIYCVLMWPDNFDLKFAVNGPVEGLRDYLSIAERHAANVNDQRAREAWASHADRCRRELVRRNKQAGGKVGGRSRSGAKIAASRTNAARARAVRKRRYPRCPGYKNHSHRFGPQGECYSPVCRQQYPDLKR